MDKEQVINIVHSYKKAIYPIVGDAQVYLYGSYSKGTARTDSDIDVAVIVPKMKEDWWETSSKLWSATRKVSTLIEPVLMADDCPSPLYDDVMRTGVAI